MVTINVLQGVNMQPVADRIKKAYRHVIVPSPYANRTAVIGATAIQKTIQLVS
jgi:hypothetical protein